MSDSYGPALPPGLRKQSLQELDDDAGDMIGPAIPPHKGERADSSDSNSGMPLGYSYSNCGSDESNGSDPQKPGAKDAVIGPVLPEHLLSSAAVSPSLPEHLEEKVSDDEAIIGPALPPGLKQSKVEEDNIVGTRIPDNLKQKRYPSTVGPALPPGFQRQASYDDDDEEEDEDDDIIGPLPSRGPTGYTQTEEFERRAQKMKDKLSGKGETKPVERESWMLELPTSGIGQQLGLGLQARTFRANAAPSMKPEDRSGWTETPEDREKKAKGEVTRKRTSDDVRQSGTNVRDRKLAEEIDTYNKKKRSKSLMDMHKEKQDIKKDKDKDKPIERRPFDREQDLKTNVFDDAKRKLLIKKSQQLNTRFSHGTTKFV